MVVLPVATLLAKPWPLMPAAAAFDELQTTELVMSCVLESLKVPVAVNCFVVPAAMDGVAGETAIETRCAGTTVRTVVSVNEPTVAVMVVEPAATVVAKPELSIVATASADEVQATPLARSWLVPSL